MSYLGFYIDPTKICVFSKTTCGYCNKAKNLLNTYNFKYQVYELDTQQNPYFLGQQLKQLTNQTTVPNIFINGKHIGGYNELYKLHKTGELQTIVESYNTDFQYLCHNCGITSKSNILSCNCSHYQYDDWGRPM